MLFRSRRFLNLLCYLSPEPAPSQCRRTLSASALSRLLEKPEREPSQILDFDFGAFDEILGSVFYQNDPAKRGNREKDQPEHQTKIAHYVTLRVSGFGRKRVRVALQGFFIATKGMLFRGRDTTISA